MAELGFEQNINQSLAVHLSPRLLNMLRILSLPYVEIVSEIEKASEENPFLEIERHEALIEYINYLGSGKKIRKEVDFEEYKGLESIKGTKQTLKEFLMEQLNLAEIKDKEKKIAEALIDEIDSHGYLKNYEEIKAHLITEMSVSQSMVDRALDVIQTFEPEGVGARDLKECLLIQTHEFGFDNVELEEVIEEAIEKHLDDLGNKNSKKVADAMGITEEGALEIMDFIKKNLNPYPASSFGEEAQQVIPSFAVEYEAENIKLINLEEKYGPKISISSDYQKMLKNPKTDAETMKFLKEKLERAKEMIENLQKRGETSQAIMNIIVETQKDFFEKGPAHLLPLEQQTLARQLGLHPSTISRAVAGKYVQTPKGLLPLKFLCPREFRGHSPASIKARIIDIVADEYKKNPLSDEQIKDILFKEGIRIERRTIAAYRKQLGILPSDERMVL